MAFRVRWACLPSPKGKSGSIEISNAGADGYVVVDGLQLVPEAEAIAERNTRADAGFPIKTSEARWCR
jgi:hypothetical protein